MLKNETSSDSGLQAFASQPLNELGQGVVLVARPMGKTQVTVATFMVDVHCLGVRQVSVTTMPAAALLNKVLPVLHAQQATAPVPVDVARGIVEGAVAYAKKLGFAPPETLAGGMEIFGTAKAAPPPFAFGKNGRPFYTQQPGDSADFVESVLARLEKVCGPDGFGQELSELGEDWLDGEERDEPSEEE